MPGERIEHMVLGGLLSDPVFTKVALPHLDAQYFRYKPEQTLFEAIAKHLETYKARPQESNLRDAITRKKLHDELEKETFASLKCVLHESGGSETQPLLDRAEEWVSQRAIEEALMKSIYIVEGSSKSKQSRTDIPHILRDALQVGFNRKPLGVCAADVQIEPIRPLWWPMLIKEKMHVLASQPGLGKGLVLMDIVARITTGDCWPLSDERAPTGTVIWCDTEDGLSDTLVPRAVGAGADLNKLIFFDKPSDFFKVDLAHIIRERDVKLIVMNPGISFLRGLDKPNDEMQTREALDELQQAIKGTDCAIVFSAHPNKKDGMGSVERIMGSRAWTGYPRSVLVLRKESDEDNTKRMQHTKWNCSTRGNDLILKVIPDPNNPRSQQLRIEWTVAEENLDFEDAFDTRKKTTGPDGKPLAKDWLEDRLRGRGDVLRAEVIADARLAGYSEDALKAVMKRHKGVFGYRDHGRHTHWFLEKEQVKPNGEATNPLTGVRLNS